jgi:phospholipid/cholesterol/gamma-HCH transport system permease protein
MATMRVNREISFLDSQGLDPMVYLVMPRVLGVMVSVFCLSIIFILTSMVSGYLVSYFMNVHALSPGLFLNQVLKAVKPADVANLFAKTLISGALTATICSVEGLRIRGAATEIPQAATRGLTRSITALFVTSVLVSVLTYV